MSTTITPQHVAVDSGHASREVEISRCLRRIVYSCGYVETVSSDG